jgi:hypothetical protein
VADTDTHNPQRYLAHAATSDRLRSDREADVLTEFLNEKDEDFHRHDGRNGKPSEDLDNIVYHEVELSYAGLRRRADAIVFYRGTEFYLVEVKERLDDELIGQLLVRDRLFRNTEPLHHFEPKKLAVVADAKDELTRLIRDRYDIETRTVDYGL